MHLSTGKELRLLDQLGRPLHDLRISVKDKCNFRCPYCMPVETYNENYDFLKKQQLLSSLSININLNFKRRIVIRALNTYNFVNR